MFMTGTLRLDVAESFLNEARLLKPKASCAGDEDCEAKAAFDHWIAQGRTTGETIRIDGDLVGPGVIRMNDDLDEQQ
jgi:hypothetical protein